MRVRFTRMHVKTTATQKNYQPWAYTRYIGNDPEPRLFIFTTIMINYLLNCVYPNPPCQLSLWEETGAPGENPRL